MGQVWWNRDMEGGLGIEGGFGAFPGGDKDAVDLLCSLRLPLHCLSEWAPNVIILSVIMNLRLSGWASSATYGQGSLISWEAAGSLQLPGLLGLPWVLGWHCWGPSPLL